jgi:hypothetical protein
MSNESRNGLRNGGIANLNGRKKGIPNRITSTTKELIAEIVQDNLEQVQKDIEQMKPSERVNVVIKLLDFVVPKQKAIEVNDVSEALFKPITINHN